MDTHDGLDRKFEGMLHIEANAGRFTKPVDDKYVEVQ